MINNKDAYKVNKAAVFPKEKIIEYYVEYYGEEYRQQITNRLNNLDVVFVPTDLASFKIREAVKNKFQDYPTVDWEEDAKLTLQILKMFANNNVIASPELLATCSDILTNLGFDMKKILVKSKETGELTIVNSDEKKRLLNYIQASKASTKIKEINVDKFITAYNSRTENEDAVAKLDVKNLNNKDKIFLQDIFKVKGPITQWKDDYINYFLSGINKLFNKNYSKISDFLEDQTMLYFKDILNSTIKNSSTDLNIENRDKKQYASIGELLEFKLDPSINAYYDGEYNSVVLPLNGKISFGTVLHEINHALGNSKIGNKETNFNKASVGFNEIVNEYLTQQAMKNIKDEDKRDLSLGFKRDTGYQTGVAFMEKFLRKFEPILKKCQMSGNAPQVIKDFIGEKNFNTLMAMGDHLEKFNYGKVILPADEIDGNVHDIVEDFRKNPNNNLYSKNSNELRMLVMMENFMDDMIEKYAEFEQGKITDIEIRADIENKVEQEIDE